MLSPISILIASVLIGCKSKYDRIEPCWSHRDSNETGDYDSSWYSDSGSSVDTNDDIPPDVSVMVDITATGVEVLLLNNTPSFDSFGIVQTGTADDWTGEDCVGGYTDGDGTILDFCHPLSLSGSSFLVPDPIDFDTFDASTNTLFQEGLEGEIGWVVFNSSTMECAVGGSGRAYYEAAGCWEL